MFGYTPQRAKRHWNAHSYDSFIRHVKGDKYLLYTVNWNDKPHLVSQGIIIPTPRRWSGPGL